MTKVKLSPNEKLMLMYLTQNGKRVKGVIISRAIRAEIADFVGCSPRTVTNLNRKLVERGFISIGMLALNEYDKTIYTILKEDF